MHQIEKYSLTESSLRATSEEFPGGVEILAFERYGRFREGNTTTILDKYISEIPSIWISYPETVKRILYSLDRLGFRLETFGGSENYYHVYWIRIDLDGSQLTLYFSENGSPSRWFLS